MVLSRLLKYNISFFVSQEQVENNFNASFNNAESVWVLPTVSVTTRLCVVHRLHLLSAQQDNHCPSVLLCNHNTFTPKASWQVRHIPHSEATDLARSERRANASSWQLWLLIKAQLICQFFLFLKTLITLTPVDEMFLPPVVCSNSCCYIG